MKFPLLTKILAIGAIVFLLMLVLLRIDWLVSERQIHQRNAIDGVSASLAGEQTMLGPWLVRSCTETWDEVIKEGKTTTTRTDSRSDSLVQMPSQLDVLGDVRSQALERGLFRVNTYAARLMLSARWDTLEALQPRALHKGSRVQCGAPHVLLAVSDTRGIRQVSVRVDDQPARVQGGNFDSRWGPGWHATLAADTSASPAAPLRLAVQMELAGTQRLAVVPAAEQATLSLRSDWPHPSFGGRFLPLTREIASTGFKATWAASAVSSTAAERVRAGSNPCGGVQRPWLACLDSFDVSLFDPVNPYTLTDRATKYALLFIVLTFAAVAMAEVLGGRRVHPVQYTLVGLALALFYLLLLSLSEHIDFATAYAAASAACVLLLGYYATHMFGRARAGVFFGAGMAALYGLLWVLLQAEDVALAIGSVLLFAVLAAVMVATRKLDWYALLGRVAGTPAPRSDANPTPS